MPTIRFSNITRLTYHTYRVSGSNAQAIALQFQVCRSYIDSFCTGSSRLIYEPYRVGTNPATGVWQEWNALGPQAKWWMTSIAATNTCGRDNPCTVVTLLATYPNLDIRNSSNIGVLLKAGSGWPSFDGYVDNLSIGINGLDTTYNFERYLPVHNITQDLKYPTIQEGVDNANPGDVLLVAPGTYGESIVVDKDGLTLREPNVGINPHGATPRIAEAVIQPTEWYGFYITAEDVTLDGFTLNGQGTTCDYGIYVYLTAGQGGLNRPTTSCAMSVPWVLSAG
jgi:hypothetical protein